MSTLQDSFETIDRSTVTQAIVGGVGVAGAVALAFSALALYSFFIIGFVEVLSNAGVEFTPAESETLQLMFELPVIATMGVAATRLVNLLWERDYSLKTAATVAAGGWTVAAAAHIYLLRWGVL